MCTTDSHGYIYQSVTDNNSSQVRGVFAKVDLEIPAFKLPLNINSAFLILVVNILLTGFHVVSLSF